MTKKNQKKLHEYQIKKRDIDFLTLQIIQL